MLIAKKTENLASFCLVDSSHKQKRALGREGLEQSVKSLLYLNDNLLPDIEVPIDNLLYYSCENFRHCAIVGHSRSEDYTQI